MNAISSKSEHDLAAVSYYVMPTPWMRAAWDEIMPTEPFGDAAQRIPPENWREILGPVGVGRLLNVSPPPPRLFANAVYRRDYVLVGPNLWLLLKEKFGSDTELRLPVTIHEAAESGLAVRASGAQLIEVPATARFPYEKWFGPGADLSDGAASNGGGWLASGSSNFASLAQAAPGNVSDDDDDDSQILVRDANRLAMDVLAPRHGILPFPILFRFPMEEEPSLATTGWHLLPCSSCPCQQRTRR